MGLYVYVNSFNPLGAVAVAAKCPVARTESKIDYKLVSGVKNSIADYTIN